MSRIYFANEGILNCVRGGSLGEIGVYIPGRHLLRRLLLYQIRKVSRISHQKVRPYNPEGCGQALKVPILPNTIACHVTLSYTSTQCTSTSTKTESRYFFPNVLCLLLTCTCHPEKQLASIEYMIRTNDPLLLEA